MTTTSRRTTVGMTLPWTCQLVGVAVMLSTILILPLTTAFAPLTQTSGLSTAPVSNTRLFQSSSTSSPEIANRLRADLRDVLERGSPLSPQDTVLERHRKPAILQDDRDHVVKSLRMLNRMASIGVEATEEDYQLVLRALLSRGRLRWIVETTTSDDDSFQPRSSTSVTCAADQMELLLPKVTHPEDTTKWSTATYNLVLEGYAVCASPRGARDYAVRAQELYDSMEAPDAMSKVHLLHAWAWQQASKQPADPCATKATALLDELMQERRQVLNSVQDDDDDTATTTKDLFAVEDGLLLECHDWVLEAWSKSLGHYSNALAVFQQRLELMESMNNAIDDTKVHHPDEVTQPQQVPTKHRIPMSTYTNLIVALTRKRRMDRNRDDHQDYHKQQQEQYNAVSLAQDYLYEMSERYLDGKYFDGNDQPEFIAYNSVISAWSRLEEPQKAEDVLWYAENQLAPYAPGIRVDTLTCNVVLHAYTARGKRQGVTHASRKVMERVEGLVEFMEVESNKRPELRPNCYSYTVLLKALFFSGVPLSMDLVEEIVEKMDQSIDPATTNPYDKKQAIMNLNLIFNGYARSGDKDAARRAHQLLWQLKDTRHLEPDVVTYTTVMESYAKSPWEADSAQKCLELLEAAKAAYRASQDPAHRPNARTYGVAIRALGKYPQEFRNAAKTARNLLLDLVNQYNATGDESLRPDNHVYNHVINCAANTEGSKEDKIAAFQVAAKTYQDLRFAEEVEVDSYTYAFWIKACNTLLTVSEFYVKCVTLSLTQCKKDGLMNDEVLKRIQQGHLSGSRLLELLGVGPDGQEKNYYTTDDLNPMWSRNVAKKQWKRR